MPIKYRLHVLDAGEPRYNEGLWAVLPLDDQERLPIATADHADDAYPPARKQAEYDAHLIAAAPELYEALAECLERGGTTRGEWMPDSTYAKARAALAKARGEA